jgi:hypothetical protein
VKIVLVLVGDHQAVAFFFAKIFTDIRGIKIFRKDFAPEAQVFPGGNAAYKRVIQPG